MLFYYCFNEVLSKAKVCGIALIVLCIIFLAFDEKKVKDSEEEEYTVQEKRVFGGFAILCGTMAPLFWTFKAYYLRKTINEQRFHSTFDIALDNQVYQGIVYTLLFLVYICTHDIDI